MKVMPPEFSHLMKLAEKLAENGFPTMDYHNSQQISWYNQYIIYVYSNQSTTVSFNGLGGGIRSKWPPQQP